MKRFINADIIPGEISSAITLNRFAFANGNPVSFVDPFGLWSLKGAWNVFSNWVSDTANDVKYWAVGAYNDAKQTVVDAFEAKDWTIDRYINVKERVITTTNNVVSWVDNSVVKPVTKVATVVGDWFEEAGEWLNENVSNKDGSYSLYNNQRFNKDAVFHEQLLAVTPSGPSSDLRTGNIGLGSLEAEVGVKIKNGDVKFGALASIWSPSFSFSIGKLSIDIGAEVFAVGAGFKKVNNGFSLFGAYGFGGSLTFSWND